MAAKKKEIRVVAGPGRADAAGRDPLAGDPAEAEADAADSGHARPKPRASWCAPCARTRASSRAAHDPRHRRTEGRRDQPRDVGSRSPRRRRSAARSGRGARRRPASRRSAAALAGAGSSAVLAVEHAALASYTADAYTHAHRRARRRRRAPTLVDRGAHLPGARRHADASRRVSIAPLVTDVVGVHAGIAAGVLHAADVPGQARRRRRAARADAAFRDRADRRLPRRRAARGEAPAPGRDAVDVADAADAVRQQPEPPFREAKQAVDLTQARAHRLGRPRHQGRGAHPARQGSRRVARRRAGRVAPDHRRRLAADRIARSAAPARRSRRSSISRSASPAPSSTSSA